MSNVTRMHVTPASWRLRAANGRIVADSAESYPEKRKALHGIEIVRAAATAGVRELT